jgi:hypothetical protein
MPLRLQKIRYESAFFAMLGRLLVKDSFFEFFEQKENLIMIQTNSRLYFWVRFRIEQIKLLFWWQHFKHVVHLSFNRN